MVHPHTRTPAVPTILAADDDPDDQLLLRRAFEVVGRDVNLQIVSDGEEALDYLLRRNGYGGAPRPCLVMVDLNMPRLSGDKVLQQIRKMPDLAALPVVVLTTSNHPRDIARCYGLGASSFITKPNDFVSLSEGLEILCKYWLELVALPPTGSGEPADA